MKQNHVLVLSVLTLFFLISSTTFQPGPGPRDWDNLKVLPKNLSEEQLDSTMDHFAISLGVKCNFCHVPMADTSNHHLDFASDKKDEKNIAREMYKMVSYLNANFFNPDKSDRPDTIRAIVCYTCHRGSQHVDSERFLSIIDSTMQAKRKR